MLKSKLWMCYDTTLQNSNLCEFAELFWRQRNRCLIQTLYFYFVLDRW